MDAATHVLGVCERLVVVVVVMVVDVKGLFYPLNLLTPQPPQPPHPSTS